MHENSAIRQEGIGRPLQDSFAWRILLREIISDPQERQRLAQEMGINPVTLTRWASTGMRPRVDATDGEARPRPKLQTLRKFVAVLPAASRNKVVASLCEEFPDLTTEDFHLRILKDTPAEPLTIRATCYEEVLEASALLSGPLRVLTIFDHLLEYALQQLDPERLGLAAILLQCTRPLVSGQKVRSLREHFRIGTAPWSRSREERNNYLGAESLAGQAVTTGRPYEVGDIRTYSGWLPLHKTKDEVSVAVCPILRLGRVAGCLLFSSTQPGFFTKEKAGLIKKYCYLAQAGFVEADYYAPSDIELRLMPGAEAQEPFLRLFNKHVEEMLMRGEVSSRVQAEALVMHQIEDDLIYLTSSTRIPPSTEQSTQERTTATR